MADLTNVLVAIHVSNALLGLVERAVARGEDITDEELDGAFARADRADAKWDAAHAGTGAPA